MAGGAVAPIVVTEAWRWSYQDRAAAHSPRRFASRRPALARPCKVHVARGRQLSTTSPWRHRSTERSARCGSRPAAAAAQAAAARSARHAAWSSAYRRTTEGSPSLNDSPRPRRARARRQHTRLLLLESSQGETTEFTRWICCLLRRVASLFLCPCLRRRALVTLPLHPA